MADAYFPIALAPIARRHVEECEEWGAILSFFGRTEAVEFWREQALPTPSVFPWYAYGGLGVG